MAALDLRGIRNVGDFYSQHYLDALLAGDLKTTLAQWAANETEGKGKAPNKRLAALEGQYFKARARTSGEPDVATRLEEASDFHAHVLEALGYERKPDVEPVGEDAVVPVLFSARLHSRPFLWVVEAPFAESDEDADPFEAEPLPEQLPTSADGAQLGAGTWRDLFDGELFRQEHPPRWVLFLAGSDAFLLDRDKWSQGKYLHFALGELLGLRDAKALQAVTGLLHKEVLLPESGQCLHDTLDENSHKHAFAVSTDLKLGAQRAIELIGNEAVYYKRYVAKDGVFGEGVTDQLDPAELTRESITYLFRLLFLFYVEARGSELGVVPMNSDAYREGYSLEKLRELELVPLTTPQAQDGYYIDGSLRKLFHLIQRGFGRGQLHLQEGEAPVHGTFTLSGLRSPLFDEARTPILRSVKLRNAVMQEVLQLLSLSAEKGKKARGRISYAQLGINQLGAVYEGLLSYRGFFAQEELFEIRDEKEVSDPNARTFFVPKAKVEEYKEGEKVRDEKGRPARHAKGTYLFRLAGRDREKSASYYTPEVLTKCLTKYTLKERLGEPGKDGALTADEILELTVCEPAMGSGAFLNEAVNQLAHAYLERKQAELGKQIPADQYQTEWQRVKYHFAVNNCYGVDLNPLAAELGKISLWLNVLQPGVEAPYFDQRIAVGNSLIGARREVFDAADLMKSGADCWLHKIPTRVRFGEKRPRDTVYHFLVPDLGMAPFDNDKVVKELEPENTKRITEWRREFCKPFTAMEVDRLKKLSGRVDELWDQHVRDRQELLAKIRQPPTLWGQPTPETTDENARRWRTVEECEEHARRLERPDAAGQRLKALMDYWGALWFWPIRAAKELPTREQWLADAGTLLEPGARWSGARRDVAQRTAARHRFQHWELSFAEVFAAGGGMDVFLGNPPWIKVQWTEASVLGDFEPSLVLRKQNAKQVADKRKTQLAADESAMAAYLLEFEESQAIGSALNAVQAYALLQGVQTNLYKAFLVRELALERAGGVVGMLHFKGLFDDPHGGRLRAFVTARMVLHLHFRNNLTLFSEMTHKNHYKVTICQCESKAKTQFTMVCNLFHPKTVDASLMHDGHGPVPGTNTPSGWDLRGHRSRIVDVNADALALFAKLYDAPGTPSGEARLPVVHSQEILEVLRRFADVPGTLADLGDEYFCTENFHETNQQKDGTIRRESRFPQSVDEWIVSGPHFYVGTPLNKTPNEGCSHNQDYSSIDLTVIPDDYLPRTNYVPACSAAEYRTRTPHWRGKPVTEFYRHVHREMAAPTGERTLVPCIFPPGIAHINTLLAIAFDSNDELIRYSGLSSSVVVDFFVKSTGMGHVNKTLSEQLPILSSGTVATHVSSRALRLNCLTSHYADLWSEVCPESIASDRFAKPDPRLESWSQLTKAWTRNSALRTPYSRRQALVELDALAALALNLTLDQLLVVYRVQFPVLQQYERETFYDRRGKIVFTVNKGLSGVGLDRKQWEEIKDARANDELPDWAHDAQGPFVPPFDGCDREVDLAQAYEHFSKLLGKGKN